MVVAGAGLGFTGLFGFDAVLLDVALSWTSFVAIGGGACEEENFELKLDIHDDLVGVFSVELWRPRKLGRFKEEDLETDALEGGVVLVEIGFGASVF